MADAALAPAATYDYQFGLWPEPRLWPEVAMKAFRCLPLLVVTMTPEEFAEFRDCMERNGLTVREATRVPHFDPEPVT